MTGESSESDKEASYAEQAGVTDMLGDHTKTKILASFTAQTRAVSITEIADLVGVSRSTVYDHIDELTELGVVEQKREAGGSPLYHLNRDHPAAAKFAQLVVELSKK